MAPEHVTTLSLASRRQSIAMGVAFLVVAVAVAVLAIVWVAEHSSNKLVFAVIPVAVVAVFLLIELALRILRLRVVVTPSTITTYNRSASRVTPSIFGGRTVRSVRTDQVAAVVVRDHSHLGSTRVVPSVLCHDGTEFTLDALTAESASQNERQQEQLELLRIATGVRVDGLGPVPGVTGQSGIAPPPLPVARQTPDAPPTTTAPDYPPPAGPPPNYDPARWSGVPVPVAPALPAAGTAASWQYDPVTRGAYRYFDGIRWTEWVYNGMAVSAAHIG